MAGSSCLIYCWFSGALTLGKLDTNQNCSNSSTPWSVGHPSSRSQAFRWNYRCVGNYRCLTKDFTENLLLLLNLFSSLSLSSFNFRQEGLIKLLFPENLKSNLLSHILPHFENWINRSPLIFSWMNWTGWVSDITYQVLLRQ